LDKASKGRTTITIAHRLSTIKDAAMIYVMGDGLVLEQGTHNDLLKNAEGPYARLVQAQKLKEMEQRDAEVVDTSGTNTPIPGVGSSADPSDLNAILREKQREKMAKEKADREIEEAALAEKPLGRTETSKSLASEILKQKKSQQGDADEKEYGMLYIMGRMARINKESWKHYALGIFAAACTGMVYPAFGIVFGELHGQYLVNSLEC
jgi:ATP-binding cassette, subfamily B (MDR/TAP), member 1